MSLHNVVFYLPPDMDELYRGSTEDCNKSEWFRYAMAAYLDTDSRDSEVMGKVPSEILTSGWRKHAVNVSSKVFGDMRESIPYTGETLYSLSSKAVIYRLILESTGARTIPVRFTSEELELIQGMGMTVQDAVHEHLRRVEQVARVNGWCRMIDLTPLFNRRKVTLDTNIPVSYIISKKDKSMLKSVILVTYDDFFDGKLKDVDTGMMDPIVYFFEDDVRSGKYRLKRGKNSRFLRMCHGGEL